MRLCTGKQASFEQFPRACPHAPWLSLLASSKPSLRSRVARHPVAQGAVLSLKWQYCPPVLLFPTSSGRRWVAYVQDGVRVSPQACAGGREWRSSYGV